MPRFLPLLDLLSRGTPDSLACLDKTHSRLKPRQASVRRKLFELRVPVVVLWSRMANCGQGGRDRISRPRGWGLFFR